MIVRSGYKWILSIISGVGISAYGGNTELWGFGVGESSDANDGTPDVVEVADWRLTNESFRKQFNSDEIPPSAQALTIVQGACLLEDGDFPSLPFTIREIGIFISSTDPVADPVSVSDQLPYSMVARLVIPGGIIKTAANEIQLHYRLDLSGGTISTIDVEEIRTAKIPEGLITPSTIACPDNWSRVAAFDNLFLRPAATYGGTGGVDVMANHTHGSGDYLVGVGGTHTHLSTATSQDTTVGAGPEAAGGPTHTHTLSGGSHAHGEITGNSGNQAAAVDNRPAWTDVVFCRRD